MRGDDYTLVIENKVDALEQPKQCDRLYARFRHEQNAYFLFLTPDGRTPKTASGQAKEAFKTASWREVRILLEDSIRACDSMCAPGSDVPINYLRTLREQFG